MSELEIGVSCDNTWRFDSFDLNRSPPVLLQEYPNEKYPNLWHSSQWDEIPISQEKCSEILKWSHANGMRKGTLSDSQVWKQFATQIILPLRRIFTLFSYINFEWFRKLLKQCSISFFVVLTPDPQLKTKQKKTQLIWTDQDDTLVIQCFEKFMLNKTNIDTSNPIHTLSSNDANEIIKQQGIEITFVDYAYHELKDKISHSKQSIYNRWYKLKAVAYQNWLVCFILLIIIFFFVHLLKTIGKSAMPEHMITPTLANKSVVRKEEMEMMMDSVEYICVDSLYYSNVLNMYRMNMLNDDDKYDSALYQGVWKHNGQLKYLSKLHTELFSNSYVTRKTKKIINRKLQQIRPFTTSSRLLKPLELSYSAITYDSVWNESYSNKMYQSKPTATNASEQPPTIENILGYKQLIISKDQIYTDRDALTCIEYLLRDGWVDTKWTNTEMPQEQDQANIKKSSDAPMSKITFPFCCHYCCFVIFLKINEQDDIYWNAWKETWKETKTEENKTCTDKKTISEYYKQINTSVCDWIIRFTAENPWGIEWLDAYHKYIHAENSYLSKCAFRQHLWYLINTDQIIFVEIFNKCVIIPRTETNNAMLCPFTVTIKEKGNKMDFDIPNVCERTSLAGCFMTSPFLRIILARRENNSQDNDTETKNDNEKTPKLFDTIFTLDESLIKKMHKAVKCKIYETPGISLLQLYRCFKAIVTPMQMLRFVCIMYQDGAIQVKTMHVPIEFRSGLGCRKCIVHDKCWIDFYFVPTEKLFF
ncbi:hypothetical protein RFI_13128 [Reticulomyxa filosa]|uniref:Uncharacterized protein n=1 Tax=Reticulomyxa filosa TaxID=46433 RepID=X6NDR0_RETFI|nr:hypothetical protein RFI_13128 [Reticulomyxa filosa]|eukprot:ETO24033.1 hypothetical protein RFI_13128 [Reticulomyxa filosa]